MLKVHRTPLFTGVSAWGAVVQEHDGASGAPHGAATRMKGEASRSSRAGKGRRRDDAPGPVPHGDSRTITPPGAGERPRRRRWDSPRRRGRWPHHWTWTSSSVAERNDHGRHQCGPSGRSSTRLGSVPVGALLERVDISRVLTAFCDGGYTTNLTIAMSRAGRAWIAFATTVSARAEKAARRGARAASYF